MKRYNIVAAFILCLLTMEVVASPDSLTVINEGKTMTFGISNDSEFLYISMKTAHRRSAMKVLQTGLSVWISSGKKKKKKLGIAYPTQNRSAKGARNKGIYARPNPDAEDRLPSVSNRMVEMVKLRAMNAKVVGLLGKRPVFLDFETDKVGFNGEMSFDPQLNVLYYKVTIPLEMISNHLDDLEDLMIGLETGISEDRDPTGPVGRARGYQSKGAAAGDYAERDGGSRPRGRGMAPGRNKAEMSLESQWVRYEVRKTQ